MDKKASQDSISQWVEYVTDPSTTETVYLNNAYRQALENRPGFQIHHICWSWLEDYQKRWQTEGCFKYAGPLMLYRKQSADGKIEQSTKDMIWYLIDPIPVKIALLTEDSKAKFAEIGGFFVDPEQPAEARARDVLLVSFASWLALAHPASPSVTRPRIFRCAACGEFSIDESRGAVGKYCSGRCRSKINERRYRAVKRKQKRQKA